MADNLGPNGLVVSAGKCAASMAAENLHFVQKILACRYFNILWGRMDFPNKVRFSAGIGPAHFLAVFEMQLRLHSKKGPHSWGRP